MNKKMITSKRLFRLLAAVPVLLSGCVEFEDYSSSKNDSEYVEMVFTQDNEGTKAEIGEEQRIFHRRRQSRTLYLWRADKTGHTDHGGRAMDSETAEK